MAFDAKQYAETLAQAAGLDDVKKAELLQVLTSEKVAKQLQDDVLRHADYSRMADDLRKKEQANDSWYQSVLQTTAANQAAVAAAEATAAKYRATYGEIEGGNPVIATSTEDITKLRTEYDNRFKTLEGQTISLLETAMFASADHLKRFGEVLNPAELKKFALEKQLPLEAAYKEFIAPRLAEQQTKDFDARIAAAREEGAKDALSKHRIPVEAAARSPHPFFDRPKTDDPIVAQGSRGLRDEFVTAYHEAGAKA